MSSPPGHQAAELAAAAAPQRLEWWLSRRLTWLVSISLCLALGGATAWNSMRESLWIDELHTAWVATGPWSELASRAAVGNQTPIYFAWQWWLGRTFGYSEVCLRATSLLAWGGALAGLAMVLHRLVRRSGLAGLWCLLALTALDRQQIFFATEGRPYMLLSLVVLLGWLLLSSALAAPQFNMRTTVTWIAWGMAGATAIWLQPTAVLFVAAQLVLAVWQAGRRRFVYVAIALTAVALVVLVWPMRYVLEPAWQSRQAWSAFAADLHWVNVLKQFPILVVGVPGMVAALISAWLIKRPIESGSVQRAARRTDDMWLCAWVVPLLLVIVLTASGVAPLMHARYLFAAALPLTIWTACMLSRLRSGPVVMVIACGMVLLQTVQQGSLTSWANGHLAVVRRGEPWREAVAQLQKFQTEQPGPLQIYCAANLIEGGRREFLDGSQMRQDYLSLPLRTLYPVPDRANIVSLLNDPRTWPEAIASRADTSSTRWLLVRTSKAGLAKRLQLSGLEPIEQFDFGAVQLLRF